MRLGALVPGSGAQRFPVRTTLWYSEPRCLYEALLTFFGDTSNCSPSIAHAPGRKWPLLCCSNVFLWVREVTLDEWRLTGKVRSFAHTLDVAKRASGSQVGCKANRPAIKQPSGPKAMNSSLDGLRTVCQQFPISEYQSAAL